MPVNIGERMRLKMEAIPLPDLAGKTVLDIGTDHGFWAWLSASRGASRVLGLDRNRIVKQSGFVDVIARNNETARRYWPQCEFRHTNVGKQWREFGRFDVVYLFSLYHHLYENCGSHDAIWFWLWRHTAGELLWENPTDISDPVVWANVSANKHSGYTREAIIQSAARYFDFEYIGPALHEETRSVYRFTPKRTEPKTYYGVTVDGAGGASKAFLHNDGARILEIEKALGITPYPGSLNIRLGQSFDPPGAYRVALHDPVDKGNIDGEWEPHDFEFTPVAVNGIEAWTIRGYRYAENFIELIAPVRLRDVIGKDVTVTC